MKKTIQLYFLNKGDKFEYPELKNYRNLYVKYPSESGCLIGGEILNGEDIWRPLAPGYSVSNQSDVYLL